MGVPVASTWKRRAARNILWSVTGEGTVRVLSLANIVILARGLSAADFGTFMFVQSAAVYAWLAVEFVGSGPYAVREIAANTAAVRRIFAGFFTARLVGGMTLCLVWIAANLAVDVPQIDKYTLVVAGAYFLCFPWYVDWLLRGLEQLRLLTMASVSGSSFLLIMNVLLLVSDQPLWMFSLTWAISFLIVGLFIFLARPFLIQAVLHERAGVHAAKVRARGSSTFALTGVGTLGITQLPPVALGIAGGTAEELGYFAAALRLTTLVVTGTHLLSWAVYPVLASMRSEAELLGVERALQRLLGIASVGMVVVVWPLCPYLISMLFGAEYLRALPVFYLLLLTLPIWTAVQALEWMLLARRLERERLASFALALVVLVLGLMWLAFVPAARVAAVAMGLSLLVAAAALLVYYVRAAGRMAIDRRIPFVAAAGALAFAPSALLREPVLAGALAGTAFLGGLLIAGALTPGDVVATWRALTKTKPGSAA